MLYQGYTYIILVKISVICDLMQKQTKFSIVPASHLVIFIATPQYLAKTIATVVADTSLVHVMV